MPSNNRSNRMVDQRLDVLTVPSWSATNFGGTLASFAAATVSDELVFDCFCAYL